MYGKRLLIPLLFLALGCERPAAPPGGPVARSVPTHPDSAKYLATEEPPGARGVLALRKEAKDGDEVILVGRIGGSKRPLVEGKAAFTVVDLSLKACDEDPNCFDFACQPKEVVAAASAFVKLLGTDAEVLRVDTRALLGNSSPEGRVVVVRGVAQRDAAGNLTVAAQQVYMRPPDRPQATEGVTR